MELLIDIVPTTLIFTSHNSQITEKLNLAYHESCPVTTTQGSTRICFIQFTQFIHKLYNVYMYI